MPNSSTTEYFRSDTLASPIVDVLIYPYYPVSQSAIYLSSTSSTSNSGLRMVEVNKSVLDSNISTFSILLAPGGPKGVDDPQTWTSILTPMSLVVIGMSRGTLNSGKPNKRIVMVGIVLSTEEIQQWEHNTVQRSVMVQGMDFTYYFANFSLYQFAALGVLNASPAVGGTFTSSVGGVAPSAGLSGTDPPIKTAVSLYEFMWGQIPGILIPPPTFLQNIGLGLMASTQVTLNGAGTKISQLLGINFVSLVVDIQGQESSIMPILWAFSIGDGNWLGQFKEIFCDPFYEFFVITATSTDVFTPYDQSGLTGSIPSSVSPLIPIQVKNTPTISIKMPGYPDAELYVVARVAPPPFVDQNDVLHQTEWQSLTTYTDGGFISSRVSYSLTNHCNMFFIIPTFMATAFGGAGASNLAVAVEAAGAATNLYGMSKYGYRPKSVETKWFAGNYTGLGSDLDSSFALYADQLQYLQMKLAAFHTPAPQMLEGEVVLPLRPDILPGNKFLYYPFKGNNTSFNSSYTFYVPAIRHLWQFGGVTTTTLQVTRGLPSDIYTDQDMLSNVLLGNTEMQYNTNSSTASDAGAKYVVRSDASLNSLPGISIVTVGGNLANIGSPNTAGKLH